MDWVEVRSEGKFYLECRGGNGLIAKVCALEPVIGWSKYLMPVRVTEPSQGDDRFARSLEDHVEGLQEKIRAIDRLKLSEVRFSEAFGSARMVVEAEDESTSSRNCVPRMWDFAHEVLVQLPRWLPLPVLSQIDYDQKRLHEQLGATLDSMDFAVRHDPSAIATVQTFLAVLEFRGLPASEAIVGVTGVGDLGGRLVSKFLDAGVKKVLVADQCGDRLQAVAGRGRVEAVGVAEICRADCHAQVLAADKSFSTRVADAWACNDTVMVVGGPEAGLDRFRAERSKLSQRGKEFVPSVLCGSLGLVSNLEEGLGLVPNLGDMQVRFDRLLAYLVPAVDKEIGLAGRCEMLLRGEPDVEDSARRFARSTGSVS